VARSFVLKLSTDHADPLREMRSSARMLLVYVAGLVLIWGWSLSRLYAPVPGQDLALVLVAPLAWTFGFFPVVGPLVVVLRLRAFGRTLGDVQARVRSGLPPDPAHLAELEDVLTTLAANENGIPEFVARRVVRRVIAAATTKESAGEAA
jgi:hypothetical protein